MLEFGATVGCPSSNAINDNKRAQARSDRRRVRSEESLRITLQGAERLDRRSEVIKEALVEEIQRGEQVKKRSDNTTAATQEPAGPAAQNLRESPIEPDPTPPKRLLMKSTSIATRGSGQQQTWKQNRQQKYQWRSIPAKGNIISRSSNEQ